MRMDMKFVTRLRGTAATLVTVMLITVSPAPVPGTTLIFTIPVAERVGDEALFEECEQAISVVQFREVASADRHGRLNTRKVELRRNDRSVTAVAGVNEYYETTPDLAPQLPDSFAAGQSSPPIDPLDALFAEDRVEVIAEKLHPAAKNLAKAPLPPPIDRDKFNQGSVAPLMVLQQLANSPLCTPTNRSEQSTAQKLPAAGMDEVADMVTANAADKPYTCGKFAEAHDRHVTAYDAESQWYEGSYGVLDFNNPDDKTECISIDPLLLSLISDEGYDAYRFNADGFESCLSNAEMPGNSEPKKVAAGESYSDWYGDDYDPYTNGQIGPAPSQVEKRVDADLAKSNFRVPATGDAGQSGTSYRLDFGDLIEVQATLNAIEHVRARVVEENASYFDLYGRLGYGDYEYSGSDAEAIVAQDSCDYDCFPTNPPRVDDVIGPAVRHSYQLLKASIQRAASAANGRVSQMEASYEWLEQVAYFGQADNGKPRPSSRAEFVTRGQRTQAPFYDYTAMVPCRNDVKLPLITSRKKPGMMLTGIEYCEIAAHVVISRLEAVRASVLDSVWRLAAAGQRQLRSAERTNHHPERLLEF